MPHPFKALLAALLLVPALASAAEITLPAGKLSLALPADFTALTQKEIKARFGALGQLPVAVYGNATRTATVAVTSTQVDNGPLKPEGLPAVQTQMADGMTQQIPGLRWVGKAQPVLAGKRWVKLENLTPSRNGAMHNVILGTDVRGQLLLVNMNAADKEFAQHAASFASMEKGLLVK